MVHRDIKPANILLDNGHGKLSDLGLAQMLTPGMTMTGVGPVGSIEYMEPDVIWGERAARASDVWSLGLTLHRVVTGAGVFGTIPEHNCSMRFVTYSTPFPGAEPVVDSRVAVDHRASIGSRAR